VKEHDRLAGWVLGGGKLVLGLLVVIILYVATGLIYAYLVQRSAQREETQSLDRARPDQILLTNIRVDSESGSPRLVAEMRNTSSFIVNYVRVEATSIDCPPPSPCQTRRLMVLDAGEAYCRTCKTLWVVPGSSQTISLTIPAGADATGFDKWSWRVVSVSAKPVNTH
jgi:hypothetical protein